MKLMYAILGSGLLFGACATDNVDPNHIDNNAIDVSLPRHMPTQELNGAAGGSRTGSSKRSRGALRRSRLSSASSRSTTKRDSRTSSASACSVATTERACACSRPTIPRSSRRSRPRRRAS